MRFNSENIQRDMKGEGMYTTIKKLVLAFVFLNVFTLQSLMADMMFYYSAAILPSIVASQKQTLTANFDNMNLSEITTATVHVLDNDVIPAGSDITILLEEYTDTYTAGPIARYEGTWQVVGDTVTFTPDAGFSGGIVQIWYKIIDQHGHESTNWINLEYPVFIQAFHDEVSPADIVAVNMDVLANDTNGSSVTSVLLEIYDFSGPRYVDRVETSEGNWSVEANLSITFTPKRDFGGGDVWANYQIMDADGHKSKVDIAVKYPVFVRAEYDYVKPSDIEQTTVHVLDNDTNSSSVTLSLESYDQYGNPVYVTSLVTAEGTWIVDGPDIVFVPNENFAGGFVSISYRIIDDQGRASESWVTIEFPTFVQARYDYVQMSTVEPVTVDVLANDIVGEGIMPDVRLVDYANGEPEPDYVKSLETFDGNWTVEANQSITFVPSENFNARNIHMEYRLSDGAGHRSQTGLDIEYPTELYAEQDYVSKSIIEPVTIDVLANDINTSTVTVKFEIFYNGTQYVDFVETFDGNWTIEANQSVTFTPNPSFGGGPTGMQYQITDQEDRTASAWIQIDYPEYVYAEWDYIHADLIEPVSVNVLANDRYTTEVTITLVNHNYDTGEEMIGTTFTTYQGTWSVEEDNTVLFTPADDFAGGQAHMEYQLTDQEGRKSRTIIEIEYPLGPTPACPLVQLDTIGDVYTTIANSLSFSVNDRGEREFDAELDQDAYEIDTVLDTATAVTGLNPMFMVYYYEETRMTSTGDTFIQAEMDHTEISLDDGNATWNYDDFASGNDRGYKYLASESAGGSYTVDANGSNILSIDGEGPVFAFKAVRLITQSEINNILETAGIHLTLDGDDTAQMNFTKELMTEYQWWGPLDQESYADLAAFISANTYNSSDTQFYNSGVLRTQNWQKVIIFAEGSAGQQSGTLIEIDRQTNAILNDNAGTWEIRNIDDDGDNYDIIVAETTLCGYQDQIFKLDGMTIIQGQIENEAGVIGAEFAYSESLKDKLENYFIAQAPLDIDPSTPTNPEITEDMLSGGRVFYVQGIDIGNGQTLYQKITIDPDTGAFIRREIIVDRASDTVVDDHTFISSYELENGRIRLQNSDIKIGLNQITADEDWDVTIYAWDWMKYALWMLNKPSDFPID